jgi:hypothetical protein
MLKMLTSRSVYNHCYTSSVGNKIQISLICRHTNWGWTDMQLLYVMRLSLNRKLYFKLMKCPDQLGIQPVNIVFGKYNGEHFSFLVISYDLHLVTHVTVRRNRKLEPDQIIYKKESFYVLRMRKFRFILH